MKTLRIFQLLGVAACSGTLFIQPVCAEPELDLQQSRTAMTDDSPFLQGWRFEMGPLFRCNMRVGFGGSSYIQNPVFPAGVGPVNAYADRIYSDGYVKRDAGTGNPASLDPSATWNWGYNNASQYNSAAKTLSFHGYGNDGWTADNNGIVSGRTATDSAGFEMAVAGRMAACSWFKLDFAAGVEAVWGVQNSWSSPIYNASLSRVDVTDIYSTSGISVPAAGYQGTYNGPLGTASSAPVISNLPSIRQVNVVSVGSATDAYTIKTRADVFELWVGPRLEVQPACRVSLYLNPKVGGAFVNVRADRTEDLVGTISSGVLGTLQSWQDSAREKSWMFMAGVTAGVAVKVYENVCVDLHGGYEWAGSHADFQVGPSSVSLNPSGYTAGFSVQIPIEDY